MFVQQTYAKVGTPGRASYESQMLTARWEWAWRLNASSYFNMVDAWVAQGVQQLDQ
jgi:hypothetical protein